MFQLFSLHHHSTMALAPYENLKGFASSRPPLMIFVLCMGLFGLILMSLAYYVKMTEMIPADTSQVIVLATVPQ